MKQTKTTFHNDLSNWEHLLAEYKKAYPKNIGVMVRKYLSLFMMLFGVLMFVNATSDSTAVLQKAPCLISPVMVIFGLILFLKRKPKSETPKPLASKLEQCITGAETKYSSYPDVMEYIKQYKATVDAETKRKQKIKQCFWIAFCGFFIIYMLIVAARFAHNSDNNLRNVAADDNICRILELEDDVPFLTLTPYKTDITDSIQLESKSLDVFLYSKYTSDENSGIDLRCFTAKKPKISGGSGKFRLIITDENGNFIHRCPYFAFETTDDDEVIQSRFLQYDTDKFDLNSLQTIETLRYLQDNKEHLRFIVEKK